MATSRFAAFKELSLFEVAEELGPTTLSSVWEREGKPEVAHGTGGLDSLLQEGLKLIQKPKQD